MVRCGVARVQRDQSVHRRQLHVLDVAAHELQRIRAQRLGQRVRGGDQFAALFDADDQDLSLQHVLAEVPGSKRQVTLAAADVDEAQRLRVAGRIAKAAVLREVEQDLGEAVDLGVLVGELRPRAAVVIDDREGFQERLRRLAEERRLLGVVRSSWRPRLAGAMADQLRVGRGCGLQLPVGRGRRQHRRAEWTAQLLVDERQALADGEVLRRIAALFAQGERQV